MPTIEERLQRLEDQQAIYQLVCGYGYSVDGLNKDAIAEIYAEDGVYVVSDGGAYVGREGVASIIDMDGHIDLVTEGAAHLSTVPYVVIEGDRAAATCHTSLLRYDRVKKEFYIWRLSASRVECERTPEGWRIKHRQNSMLQEDLSGSKLLGRLMEGPSR